MKSFFREKSMCVYVSSVKAKMIDTKVSDYATTLEVLEVDNSKIVNWVNNSVTHLIDA